MTSITNYDLNRLLGLLPAEKATPEVETALNNAIRADPSGSALLVDPSEVESVAKILARHSDAELDAFEVPTVNLKSISPAALQAIPDGLVQRIEDVRTQLALLCRHYALGGNKANEAEIQRLLSNLEIPSYLKVPNNFLRWAVVDSLENIHNLSRLGHHQLAGEKLRQLEYTVDRLLAVGPTGVYRTSRIGVPLVFLRPGEFTTRLGRLVDVAPRFASPLEEPSFSPEEHRGWRRTLGRLDEFNRALHSGEGETVAKEDVEKALIELGLSKTDIVTDIKLLKAGNKWVVEVLKTSEMTFLPTSGQVFLNTSEMSRNIVLATFANYEASRQGFPSGFQSISAFARMRNLQLSFAISRILTEHPEKFGLTKKNLDFEKSVQKDLLTMRPTVADEIASLGCLAGQNPIRISLKPPSLVGFNASSEAAASEYYWLANGSSAFGAANPEIQWLLEHDRGLPDGPALSIGSGDGAEPRYIAEHGSFSTVFVLDHSSTVTHRVDGMSRLQTDPPIEGICADAAHYAYPKENYSRIVAINVMEYLPEPSWASFLSKISGALIPGGKASIVVDLAEGHGYETVALRDVDDTPGDQDITEKYGGTYTNTKHFFTKDEFKGLVGEANLARDIDVTYEEKVFNTFSALIITFQRKPRTTN